MTFWAYVWDMCRTYGAGHSHTSCTRRLASLCVVDPALTLRPRSGRDDREGRRERMCRTYGAGHSYTSCTQRLRTGLVCGAPPALGIAVRCGPRA